MAEWTHSICDDCWDKQNPDRPAHRLEAGEIAQCCWCHVVHRSGIYTRSDPQSTPCGGAGSEHVEFIT